MALPAIILRSNVSLAMSSIHSSTSSSLLSLKFRSQMVTRIQHLQTPISSLAALKNHFQKAQTIQLVIKLTCVETLQEARARAHAKKSKRAHIHPMRDCVR
jgi:hypothetical protein